MNFMTLLSLPLWIAGLAGAHHLVIVILRNVILFISPLTGEKDKVTYHRSMFTPGSREVWALWVLLVTSGIVWWLWLSLGHHSLQGPAIVLFSVSIIWELWTWERVAASHRHIAWRRGWRQGTRRVNVRSVRNVRVSEQHSPLVLGRWVHSTCRLTVILRNGKSARLPGTSTLAGLHDVEGASDFIQTRVENAVQERRRMAATSARSSRSSTLQETGPSSFHSKHSLSPEEQELRERLAALRRAKAAGQTTAKTHASPRSSASTKKTASSRSTSSSQKTAKASQH